MIVIFCRQPIIGVNYRMKTAFGKLIMLALVLTIGLLLLAPMRSGIEDSLTASIEEAFLEPGQTAMVTYELVAEAAQTVAYSSDDSHIATVTQQGLITAVSPGETTVRLTAQGGVSTKVDVHVAGIPVRTFALNTHSIEMDKGDVSGLSYTFNYGAMEQNVSWSSANPEIVSVDAAGRLTALSAGETYVTAVTSGGMSDSALIRVNVRAKAVKIVPEALTVGVGTAFRLSADFLPEDATDEIVSWTSSLPQVLSVDDEGMTRAISAGTAKVSVTTRDGLTASTLIEVEPASKAFLLNPAELTLERGSAQDLEACFIGSDGQPDVNVNHHIQWESSDETVAVVEDGHVRALKSGRATITASADGFEARCAVKVRTSVTEVHLNIAEQTFYQNQDLKPFLFRTTIIPEDADDKSLTFTSDNELVAKVSSNGLVTLTGGCGTAVITVTAKSGATASCVLNVLVAGQ